MYSVKRAISNSIELSSKCLSIDLVIDDEQISTIELIQQTTFVVVVFVHETISIEENLVVYSRAILRVFFFLASCFDKKEREREREILLSITFVLACTLV